MRIVGRKHKEPIVGLANKFADVFEGIGRKAQLVVDLFGRWPLHFAQMRLGLAPYINDMIEASSHRRNPSGTELDTSTSQSGKSIEHTVEDQHREKSLGSVKDA